MKNRCLLDQMLEPDGLSTLFQPILEARDNGWGLHALECLTRGPKGTNLEPANLLFEYVRRKRKECELDRVCVARALRCAGELDTDASFSVNVHASTLGSDPEFPFFLEDMAEQSAIRASRLIVEIVEHTPFWDEATFLTSLETLRRMRIRVALDDIGIKHSNFRMVLNCRPDYFKIDRYLVEGCRDDYHRRVILESISNLARKFGSRVVAEGVTNPEDLHVVLDLGIDLVQGYLFYPALAPEELLATPILHGLLDDPHADIINGTPQAEGRARVGGHA
jgi:EAL domain-containing protein (putative c-di-GMP-specific phosphodiesterase class I)